MMIVDRLQCILTVIDLINLFFSLELNMEMPQGETASIGTATAQSTEQDDLSRRLAQLRHM